MTAHRAARTILTWFVCGLLGLSWLVAPATAMAETGNEVVLVETVDELMEEAESEQLPEETTSQQEVVLEVASSEDEVAEPEAAKKRGWITEYGVTRYYDESGNMAVGWLTLGGKRYFFNADGAMQTGWLVRGKKTYYLNKKGVLQKGWKTIEGKRYYFSSKGVMAKGAKKIKGRRYFFTDSGVMANCGLYKNYIIAWNGVLRKIPAKKTGNKEADARRVAKLIAKCVPPKSKIKKQKDLARVSWAAQYVSAFSKRCKYTMEGNDYHTAYGVFIAKKYTCAGSTAALGMVLECMGFKWTHVNKSMMKHQWVKLKMDGKKGYADGQVGWAGYGKHPVESQL